MNAFINFKEMLKTAFKINENGEMCFYPQLSSFFTFLPDTINNENKYKVQNNIITFVFENHQYAIPYSAKALQILILQGFSYSKGIKVPFAYCDYPVNNREKWNLLLHDLT